MKWQILILTQPSRAPFLHQLILEFQRQADPRVGLLIAEYDQSKTLGENRNVLRDLAIAEYISFFDDDDWPAPDFFARIMPLLDRDYVGFRVQTYCEHLQYCAYGNTYHSLKYHDWSRVGMNFYRDVSHINPIRRELAMQADFEGGIGEDARWAKALRAKGIVKTQHYISDVMYHYIWRAVKDDAADAVHPERMKIIESIRRF